MKYIKIVLVGFLGFLSSCDGFLDVVDLDELTSGTVYKTETDLSYALNQLYTFLPQGDVEGSAPVLPYFWTDEAIHRNINDGGGRQESDFNWTINSSVLDNFYRYPEIADINFFLQALPDAEFFNESNRARFGAEARFFRAWIYEAMVFAYGDVPLITTTISADDLPERTPRIEVFNFVLSELDAIIAILPEASQYAAADNGRITKGAALALKARACLNAVGWHSDPASLYVEAEQAAAAIVNSGEYSLVEGIEGFAQQFTSASDLVSPETILATAYVPEFRTNSLPRRLPPKGAWRGLEATFGNNQSRPGFTADFIEEVQTINGLFPINDPSYDPANPWENRDPRLAVSVILPGDLLPSKGNPDLDYEFQPHPNINPNGTADNINSTVNPTGYNFRKYLTFDIPALDRADVDIKVIRYSEVLLMYAEALAGQGKEAEALVYLDQVRARVGMPLYAEIGLPTITRGTTGNQMIDAILLERRYEFAGEGPQRWFDIWRYKLGDQVITQVYGIPESTELPGDLIGPKFKADGDSYNRVWNDKFYLLPIPQKVIDANPNIRQNPGW